MQWTNRSLKLFSVAQVNLRDSLLKNLRSWRGWMGWEVFRHDWPDMMLFKAEGSNSCEKWENVVLIGFLETVPSGSFLIDGSSNSPGAERQSLDGWFSLWAMPPHRESFTSSRVYMCATQLWRGQQGVGWISRAWEIYQLSRCVIFF